MLYLVREVGTQRERFIDTVEDFCYRSAVRAYVGDVYPGVDLDGDRIDELRSSFGARFVVLGYVDTSSIPQYRYFSLSRRSYS